MIFAYFRIPKDWRNILRETAKKIDQDDCFGLAAQLAFYFLLAVFPALLFFVALLSYMPVEDSLVDFVAFLGAIAPREIVSLIRDQLEEIAREESAGLLTLGILGAVWGSSVAMAAVINGINRAYEISDWRSWWKRRLVAVALTVALTVLGIVELTLVMIGPDVAYRAADRFRLAPAVALGWEILRWPVMLASIVLAVDLIYHFAPNRAARWVWVTPGALLATGLWIVSSFGLKFYVRSVADYAATYGTIGGIIVTMLWLYICGLALLIGAELNGAIERALNSPAPSPRRAES